MARSVKSAIDGTSASPAAKRAAKATVGKRFQRGGTSKAGKTTEFMAKTGLTVGQKKSAVDKKAEKRREGSNRKGVGISSRNIGWLIWGTAPRVTTGKGRAAFEKSMASVPVGVISGHRGKGKGHKTGRVKPLFLGVTSRALAMGASAAIDAAKQKASSTLLSEVRAVVRKRMGF
jgi:hypothetical protein